MGARFRHRAIAHDFSVLFIRFTFGVVTVIKAAGKLVDIRGSLYTFAVPGRALKLESGKDYTLEIREPMSKRSLNQNALFWSIVHDITLHLRADDEPDADDWSVYTRLLKAANAKYEYMIVANEEVIDSLREAFRAVEFIGMREVLNEETGEMKAGHLVKVYTGSSKFDVSEMTLLIEKALEWAANYNLKYA